MNLIRFVLLHGKTPSFVSSGKEGFLYFGKRVQVRIAQNTAPDNN